jgi:Ca2+-binding RTX toxin-like protein
VRRTILLIAMCAMLVSIVAPAAFAAEKVGNDRANYIKETCGADLLVGRGGNDTIDANNCGPDADRLRGGTGNDRLLANDGDVTDSVIGGPGYDTCVVDARSEVDGGCERVLVREPSA